VLKNSSLIYPILGFLALTALASVTSGYFINYVPVHKRIHEQIDLDVTAIASDIQARIDEEVLGLPRLARLLQSDKRLRRELQAYTQNSGDPKRFHDYIERQMRLFGVSFLQLVDTQGVLIHSLNSQHINSDTPVGKRVAPEFVEDIKDSLSRKRIVLAMAEQGHKFSIHATAPLFHKGVVLGAITVGTLIDNQFSDSIAEFINTKLALVADKRGIFSVSNDNLHWPDIDNRLVSNAKRTGKLYYSEEHSEAQALFYHSVKIVDRQFVVVIYLSLEKSHAPLFESGQRLYYTAVIITILVVMLGGATYSILIHPMRHLYGKARVLLEVCSTSAGMVQPDPGHYQGNELRVLDNALETASMTVYANIGHLLEQKERFESLAVRDPLTGLGNRRMFEDLLETAVALCRRHDGKLALFYMDLDKFKPINDTLGHDIGDLLLKEVAQRLNDAVRDSDVVFRMGGDEFAAMLPECPTIELAQEVGSRVLERVRQPYHLEGHECTIGVSIGISLFPLHGKDVATLLKSADSALYEVKESGRGRCAVAKPLELIPIIS
jgi:diguanylate cyclase (GGDEF)-like protein